MWKCHCLLLFSFWIIWGGEKVSKGYRQVVVIDYPARQRGIKILLCVCIIK